MHANLVSLFRGIPARIEAGGARRGLAYPWWIPTVCAIGIVCLTIIALAQREALLTPRPVTLTLVLVIGVFVLEATTVKWAQWWVIAVLLLGSVTWLMADASNVSRPLDMAPPILAFLAAELTATDGLRIGAISTALSVGLLVAVGLDGRVLHLLEILLGLVVGCMLRWQMRALIAEREARSGERERATLAERQRIAREIHDLVGHSLSVTLLHVTGARRALTEDADVDEAVDALRDAEKIGRKAMSDIRSTVSVLASDSAGTQPLPGTNDIPDLVDGVRAAGIDIRYEAFGDPDRLARTTGLGVYRVAQESLANIAKHAPSSAVDMRLDVEPTTARLRVQNRLPHPNAPIGDGSGLGGMIARAEQLGGTCHSGPDGDRWIVDLVVPVGLETDVDDAAGGVSRPKRCKTSGVLRPAGKAQE